MLRQLKIMLWACYCLPQLALDAVLRVWADPQAPLGRLISPGTPQRRVLCKRQCRLLAEAGINDRASPCGCQHRMLSRDFAMREYDLAQNCALAMDSAAWAYRFKLACSA